MAVLIECVPNFSEGRDSNVVRRIVAAMSDVSGLRVLDYSLDAGHNRSVVTVLGSARAVAEAAFRAVDEAAKLIDLRIHRGEHPRMGATDVLPFIPVRGATMEDCVLLAREVGDRIGRELAIPVYLYEEAANKAERKNLADVRRPQFEGLRRLLGADPAWDPDFGPRAVHPTAGAVAVGARSLLVAYNVYLSTSDVSVAKAIARAVRSQTGGLRYVKALGIAANEAGRVHVSMNLTNTNATPVHRVLGLIRFEAARYGLSVVETEVVGLISADALLDAAQHDLQLNAFSRSQVLEYRLLEEEPDPALANHTVVDFSRQVALADSAPGGGSVAALVGGLAASLVSMVARLTVGRKRFAGIEAEIEQVISRAEDLRVRLLQLVDADALAYRAYVEAVRNGTVGEQGTSDRMRQAAVHAVRVPLETSRASMNALQLAVEVVRIGNPVARTDAQMAALAAYAAVLGACLNVRVNLPCLEAGQNPDCFLSEAQELEAKAAVLLAQVIDKKNVTGNTSQPDVWLSPPL
jgi:glutamate formiminotransferase / formiminotetrahydrofolate cyclodeaminase